MATSNLFRLNWTDGHPSSTAIVVSMDATYVWFTTTGLDGTSRLYRMRKSDKALIKPDGSVGTGANAYLALANGQPQSSGAFLSNGNKLYISASSPHGGNGLDVHNLTTMAYESTILTGTRFSGAHGFSYFDGQYWWACSDVFNQALYRVDTAGTFTSMLSMAGLGGQAPQVDGLGYVYLSINYGNNREIRKYRTSDMQLQWTHVYSTTGGNFPWNIVIDTNAAVPCLYYSVTGGSYSCWRVRLSDGALLNSSFGVLPQPASGQVGINFNANAGVLIDGYVYWWGTATIARSLSDAVPTNYTMQIAGGTVQPMWGGGAVTGVFNRPFFDVGTKTYYAGMTGTWATSGIAYFQYDTPDLAPNVTNVNPNGTGLDVVFDMAVNVGSPTIGAPSVKLSVSGANQDGSNTLHVGVDAIAPQLTTAAANGTGIDLVFDKPVGIVGSPSYGGIANNLQVTLAAPVSGTEIQLTANAIAPKITTAKANTDGIDLVFDRPVDLAATPDYGTGVNNLRVVTANPLSTTEVQLFTSISSNTYEWISAPQTVTGVGVLPYVTTAYARDNNTFVLIFSEDVTESSATNIANYVITPALDIVSIVKLNSTTYAMTTSQQTANTAYHVTLTGIIDRANNPI